ncbi:hypothetical protein DFP72DRAFT_1085194 [Ephemerocybe angulata]|uniref:Uncharacterized protein n=1 Tax=Ephemerocybe angulata TaxID=980116 RepID=A0A8H6H857_9AGAR|nr:hypothetical protein DFP72DRAFT_1085194 [Tulosesus angulatus]
MMLYARGAALATMDKLNRSCVGVKRGGGVKFVRMGDYFDEMVLEQAKLLVQGYDAIAAQGDRLDKAGCAYGQRDRLVSILHDCLSHKPRDQALFDTAAAAKRTTFPRALPAIPVSPSGSIDLTHPSKSAGRRKGAPREHSLKALVEDGLTIGTAALIVDFAAGIKVKLEHGI